MILIISDEYDISTNEVIDWISFHKVPYKRISDLSTVTINKIQISDKKSTVELEWQNQLSSTIKHKLSTDDIQAFWYRRGMIKPVFSTIQNKNSIDNTLRLKLNEYLTKEYHSLLDFVHLFLRTKRHIGSLIFNNINKLYNLHIAKEVGLLVPKTLIS